MTFGVNLGWLGTENRPPGHSFGGPLYAARWAEDAGFDVVTTADHVGGTSPFVMLSAAAVVTTRVRLRTYVLDYGFWNPGLLARDVATLDVLSGGRVEVGLGAGHKPLEHEAVGVPFPSIPLRPGRTYLVDGPYEVFVADGIVQEARPKVGRSTERFRRDDAQPPKGKRPG